MTDPHHPADEPARDQDERPDLPETALTDEGADADPAGGDATPEGDAGSADPADETGADATALDAADPQADLFDDDDDDIAPPPPESGAEYAAVYADEVPGPDPVDAEAEADGADDAPEPARKSSGGERIAKVMARAGVASRREAERMIVEGRVTVNGDKITSPALDVLPTDKVRIDGQPMDAPQETRLWLYYKPVGLVTSESDEKGRQTVFDALPRDLPRVMSVGRLDLNSEGLLLLTNDGELKRRLELPATGWLRRYRVRVNGTPNDLTFDPLRRGASIEGEDFQPMEIKLDSQQGANAWLTVGIREGKNREIRRAMAHVGLMVNRLIRIGYGPFKLLGMEPNEVREVRRRILRDQLGGLLTGDPDETPRALGAAGRAAAVAGAGDRAPRADGGKPRADGGKPQRGPRPDAGADRGPRPDAGDRPRKPRTPRAEGTYDRPARAEGADRKPRTPRREGEGFTPRAPRAEGEGYKPRGPRPEGAGYKPRTPRAEGEAYKPRGPRPDGEGYKPRTPRADGDSYKPRGPRPEGDSYKPRGPRTEGDSYKPRGPRTEGEGYKPRGPRTEGDSYKPRGPRADGDTYKPRTPRAEGEGYKARGPRPEGEGYKPRAPRDEGGPGGAGGERRFGPGAAGKPAGGRPGAAKPGGGKPYGKPGGAKPGGGRPFGKPQGGAGGHSSGGPGGKPGPKGPRPGGPRPGGPARPRG